MSARFIRRGVSKFLFSPAIADVNNVTRAEIASAEDLTDFIADVAGWQLTNNSVATPDMGTTFDSSIPGTDSVGDSSFTFYEDMDEETIEALLPKGTTGYVLILRKGDKPGTASLDCFPVRVATKGNEFSAGNDPARFVVTFNITDEPGIDGDVPSAGPAITTVSPAGGLAAGGTNVTISGSGFTGATGVTFGGTAATSVVVVNSTTITCTAPAHAAGAVAVVVAHPNGNATKPSGFVYV